MKCTKCGLDYFDGKVCSNCGYRYYKKFGIWSFVSISIVFLIMFLAMVHADIDQYSNDTTMTINPFCVHDNNACGTPQCNISIENLTTDSMIFVSDHLLYNLSLTTPPRHYKSMIYCKDGNANFSIFYEFDVKSDRNTVQFMTLKDNTLNITLLVLFLALCFFMTWVGLAGKVFPLTILSALGYLFIGFSIFSYFMIFAVLLMLLAVFMFFLGILQMVL